MAQFARPSADTTIGNWTDDDELTSDIYKAIDEITPDDDDFIQSELAPDSSVYVTALSSIEDPLIHTGHVVRYRYQKSAAGGAQIDLTVELREGYTNEGSLGTLIASDTVEDISNGWTTGTINLSEGEAGNITDYSDLFLRFIADQPGESS